MADPALAHLPRAFLPGPRGIPTRELRRLGLRPRGLGLIRIDRWPAEPARPPVLEPSRLAEALAELCPIGIPAANVARYARWAIDYGREFNVDPTLLAALLYHQSRCEPRRRNGYGIGLAMVNLGMHRRALRGHRFVFGVLEHGQWARRQLVLDKYRFDARSLSRPPANLYFAAAFLHAFSRQCPDIDPFFGSVPHRHPVSHFIWGDRVRSAGPEDRILLARRRLLAYYHGRPVGRPRATYAGVRLSCPLDGPPRKVISGMGDDRDGGRRRHAGVDFASSPGEPIRAVAPGKVALAGADIRGTLRSVPPRLTRLVGQHRMGPRGLLVIIDHGHDLSSMYVHLAAFTVKSGQRVERGQLLGYVGRTGMKASDAHLHFGLYLRGHPVDPIPALKPYLFGPHATYAGRNNSRKQDENRRRRRWARRHRSLTGRPWRPRHRRPPLQQRAGWAPIPMRGAPAARR